MSNLLPNEQTPTSERPCTCEPYQQGNEWHCFETEYSKTPNGDLVIIEYWQCESCFESWYVSTIIPKTDLEKYPKTIQL